MMNVSWKSRESNKHLRQNGINSQRSVQDEQTVVTKVKASENNDKSLRTT